VHHTGLH